MVSVLLFVLCVFLAPGLLELGSVRGVVSFLLVISYNVCLQCSCYIIDFLDFLFVACFDFIDFLDFLDIIDFIDFLFIDFIDFIHFLIFFPYLPYPSCSLYFPVLLSLLVPFLLFPFLFPYIKTQDPDPDN